MSKFIVIAALMAVITIVQGYFRISSVQAKSLSMMSGYIPPERDPEFRPMVKKSLLVDDVYNPNDYLPLPKQGDVVLSEGKWKGDQIVGLIRSIREAFYGNETTWIADVVPMREGKIEKIYCIDRSQKSLAVSINDLKPVKFFYVRSENGYNVTFKANSTTVALRAPSYRKIDKSLKIPMKVCVPSLYPVAYLIILLFQTINNQSLEIEMENYAELKNRCEN